MTKRAQLTAKSWGALACVAIERHRTQRVANAISRMFSAQQLTRCPTYSLKNVCKWEPVCRNHFFNGCQVDLRAWMDSSWTDERHDRRSRSSCKIEAVECPIDSNKRKTSVRCIVRRRRRVRRRKCGFECSNIDQKMWMCV